MDNFDDLFRDTNGPAYQKEQKRFGPPLEYVGEKLRNSVESWHEVLQNVSENIADDLSSGRLSIKKVNLKFIKNLHWILVAKELAS